MGLKEKIYENFKNKKFSFRTQSEICRALGARTREKNAVLGALKQLCAEGLLCHDERYRFATPEQLGALTGTVSAMKGGYAFLLPDDRQKFPKDFFIGGRNLGGAWNGDKALVIPVRSAKSGDEVRVIRVLERACKQLVGTLCRDKYGYFLHPDDGRITEDVDVPTLTVSGAKAGMKVVANLVFPENGRPIAEICEVLGNGDDFFPEELALIRAHGLREEFPEEVRREAEALPQEVRLKRGHGRLDLRDRLIITVDGEDTRDIGDAISLERAGEDFLLGVHIADVTEYVTYKSALDKEAFKRGTSVYFPDRVLPMLPKALSNGICSLNEGVDRLTLSCIMRIDKNGKVKESNIRKSVIRSTHRTTYHEIESIAAGEKEAVEKYPDLAQWVQDAFKLTKILKAARQRQGEVELEVKEAKILLDEKQKIVIPDYEHLFSQDMIEQFMVLANEAVARFMTEQKAPFVYRVHEKPTAEKAETLKNFLIGLNVPAPFAPYAVTPADYRNILQNAAGMPAFSVINRVMLRSMMKARYDSVNLGHFGLASECYCHFTSPIRRYPDLCIHRIIKEVLDGRKETAREKFGLFVAEAAVQASECEKRAIEAERDVDDLYKTAYMSDKIGEEFEGVISGVIANGFFVELNNTVEGYVGYRGMPEDDYEFFEDRFLLRGKRNSFALGESVRVTVAGCDFGERKIAFTFLEKIQKDEA